MSSWLCRLDKRGAGTSARCCAPVTARRLDLVLEDSEEDPDAVGLIRVIAHASFAAASQVISSARTRGPVWCSRGTRVRAAAIPP
jgi:hypothetical protein